MSPGSKTLLKHEDSWFIDFSPIFVSNIQNVTFSVKLWLYYISAKKNSKAVWLKKRSSVLKIKKLKLSRQYLHCTFFTFNLTFIHALNNKKHFVSMFSTLRLLLCHFNSEILHATIFCNLIQQEVQSQWSSSSLQIIAS